VTPGEIPAGATAPAAAPGLERLRIDRDAGAAGRRRRSGVKLAVAAVVALLVLGGAWALVGEELTAPSVRTAKVRRVSATEGAVETTASGYVVARRRAAISSKLSGRLDKLLVDVGDRVAEGQLLGELGHADLDAAVARARADAETRRRHVATARARRASTQAAAKASRSRVREAEAAAAEMATRLTDAERSLALQERLAQGGAGIRDALDAAKAARDVMEAQTEKARASVAMLGADADRADADVAAADAEIAAAEAAVTAAEAALAQAEATRRDADIVAPFAGVVVRKEAEVGEMVSPVNAAGSTTRGAVVSLVDFASLEMEVDVIERDISKVREGADCRIVLDSRRDAPYAGAVRQIVPTAERSTSTVRVKVAFRKLDDRVLPEMGGRVEFLAEGRGEAALGRDRVLAPAAAFVERDGRSGVLAVRDGRVEWIEARPADGAPSDGDVEVVEGLSGGEDVVLSPPASLAPRSRVRVLPE
jgi:RND family efflux transporter MFP subunit